MLEIRPSIARDGYESGSDTVSQHGGLSEIVYHRLFTTIARGELVRNQRLPSENVLAQTYGVSRPIVRAALERLRNDGLIYSRRGSGSYIKIETAEFAVGFRAIGTIVDIQRCFELRTVLESEAAYLAASRANRDLISQIMATMAPLVKRARQYRYEHDADFAFHYAIAEATNNHYFARTLVAMKEHILVAMKMGGTCLVGTDRKIDLVIEEHARIIRHITDRNPEAARMAMRDHITNARNRVFENKDIDLSFQ